MGVFICVCVWVVGGMCAPECGAEEGWTKPSDSDAVSGCCEPP